MGSNALFKTPEGTVDLRKILAVADFPLYILKNPLLAFRLWSVSFTYGETPRPDLNQVSFHFTRPFAFTPAGDIELVQRLGIVNYHSYGEPDASIASELYAELAGTAGPVCYGRLLQTPPEFDFMWDMSQYERHDPQFRQLVSQIAWESLSTSLVQFKMYHWDAEASISLAYGATEKTLIVLSAVGISRLDLIEALASLIPLRQDDDRLISGFQNEMKTADEEFRRYQRPRRDIGE